MPTEKKIVIAEPRLAQYRVRLFELMKQKLEALKIQFSLLVGKATRDEEARGDTGHLDWAVQVPTTFFAGERLCWQPLGRYLNGADLVVVNQHNKLLYNYRMMLLPRPFKLAFWDHGRNMQSRDQDGFKERLKAWTTTRVDWWFAYTSVSARTVGARGFPPERITVVNNSIDTSELAGFARDVKTGEVQALKSSLGLADKRVGLYLGSLYSEKRLDFLVQSVEAARRKIDNFELLIIGDGLDRDRVRQWAAEHPWIHWVGAKRGRDKALYARVADIMLIPAQVGLVILDAFVLEMPLLTTDYPNHSPEVGYLEQGVNGLMTPSTVEAYSESIARVLNNHELLASLRAGCRNSAAEYSVENMADRFVGGILDALQAPA